MTALAEKNHNEVLDLPTDERLSVIDKLLHLIPIPASADIEKSWLKESHKRPVDIRSGKAKALAGESVFQEIKESFQK